MTGDYDGTVHDLNIVKLDASGNLVWDKTIGDAANSVGNSLVQTKDGGYIATGYTTAYGVGGEDVYVVKLDKNGNLKWTKTIGGPDDDWGNSIIETKDGGFAIAGAAHSYGGGGGFPVVYVIKLDSLGNKKWTKTIVGSVGADAVGYSIIQTKDEGYAVTGSTIMNRGFDNVFTFKLDSVGNLVWANSIGGTKGEEGYDMIQTSDDGFAIVGLASSFGAEPTIYLLKLNSVGNLIWSRTIGDTTVGYSIAQTKDRGFVISGLYSDSGCVCKLDSVGSLLWFSHLGLKTSDFFSVTQTKGGGFVAVGFYSNTGMYFLKTDSSGNSCNLIRSSISVGTGGAVTAGGIITSSDSGRMGSGGIIGNGGTLTVICKVTDVEEINNGGETFEVYPNPSKGVFTIQLSVVSSQWSVEVYNVMGQKVLTEILRAVQGDNHINLTNQPNGVYFYRVLKEDGSVVGEGKMVIEK